jgi:ribosomal protein S14
MTSGYDDRVPKSPYQTAGGWNPSAEPSVDNLASVGASYGALLSDSKKWSNFKYPKSLSTFFLERPSLKSMYLLISLKDHVNASVQISKISHSNLQKSQTTDLIKIAIKDLAFKVCYSKKTKQQQNKTRIRGRCIQSNRPRSVSRLLRLSRIHTRTLALEGKITGCTRSTW